MTDFPLMTWTESCGLRLDLPKKERVHTYEYLGRDVRNCAAKGFQELDIYACTRCGHDKAKSVKEENGDTTRGISGSSESPVKSVREILLPSGDTGTVATETQEQLP